MDELMDEKMDKWKEGWVDEWVGVSIGEGRINGWVDEERRKKDKEE